MKRTLLYLLLFTTFNFYAQINPIVHCDGNTIFDLTSRESEIIGNLNPAETTVSYHISKFDADRGAYPIPNPTSFQSTGTSTIYAQIINERSISAIVKSFQLKVSATPLTLDGTVKYSGCVKSVTSLNASGGTFSYQYSKDGTNYQIEPYFYDMGPGSHTVYVKDSNNCTATTTMIVQDINIPRLEIRSVATMPRCNGASDAQIMTIVSGGTPPYNLSILEKPDAFVYLNNNFYTINNMSAGQYTVLVKDASGICSEINHIQIQETKAITAATTITDQTITVIANGGTNQYTYAISPTLNQFSGNNVFANLAPDTYEIIVRDSNFCTSEILNLTVTPPAPLVDGKNTITQSFNVGQTLADINIQVTGIKWYSNAVSPSGKTKRTTETQLPPTTVLVDGTTYYASQTINGIESKERLAVTAKLNTLSTPDFILSNFKYHPNPVKNTLSIDNTAVIDEATLFSVSGKVIFDKKINSMHSDLDLSHLATGIYILKVKSEGQEKTIKIVKE
ncbi:T9SS type A sorting domain-containing protein [Flavobacterium branchiarum]|uniref:T9SS type A sorting domain-containing protein n=1 Tax=Flavobacterium branchiarum TaxID=1114870 RepID=A0ABV5FPT4_9FLAO|nr:T9SS type A sorting domain-containing protein [Flavobacterium branchiarum]MDN3675603.1 T9SS type A sorting domain-containing protein [Flavobacterium branchiarum]